MIQNSFRLSLLLVVSLLASSCFYVGKVEIEEQDIFPDETTEVKIKLYPASNTESAHLGYTFLLIGYVDIDRGTIKKIDAGGHYGGPYTAVRDLDLRNVLLNSCATSAIPDLDEFHADEWQAWRTPVKVMADSGLSIKFRHSVTAPSTVQGGLARLVIYSGQWIDDGDGTPASVEMFCSGLSVVGINIRPSPPALRD